MNYTRIGLAAVAATVADIAYGFLVYGQLIGSEFHRYPAVYRSDETAMSHMPLGFAGILVAMIVLAMIYAKGYEGGSGVSEGARFGVLVGIFVLFAFVGVEYWLLNIGRKLAAEMGVAALGEWTVVGIVMGLVYKPGAGVTRRTA